MLVMLISAYPLLKLAKIIGLIIWIIISLITLITALKIEKIYKKYDIRTYKEIVAFTEGKSLSKTEIIEEKAKRPYQQILLGIAGGTASGKTTVAKKLKQLAEPFRKVSMLRLDFYYKVLSALLIISSLIGRLYCCTAVLFTASSSLLHA